MELLPITYFAYMFVSFYFLIFTLLLYFKNKNSLFDSPKMTKEYGISVLIPAYNESKTLANTIQAIYNVDYNNIKEVIIINDGSKDDTLKIAKELKSKYLNLKILDKPNSGKADSLNKALKYCTGELVVVVDADSYPSKDSFKKMVGYFDDLKVGAVTATCVPRNRNSFLEKLQVIEYKVIAFTRKLLEYVDAIYVVPGTAGMYRKIAIEKAGFDTKNITEDIEATWHLVHDGWKIRMCLGTYIGTEVPDKIKPWYAQRRRWALGGLQCINKYKEMIFRKGMLGYFIVPFFALGLFLGVIGIFIFLSLFIRRFLSSYLLTKYSIVLQSPVLVMEDMYITPSVLNYFGVVLFLLFFIFTFFVLAIMKDRLFEKQSFFNLLFYMTLYLLVYPMVLIVACWHFIRGKMIWR
ncbi:MAG: glycosyltransferase family 2 protein [archaeon]|nr:glycosyltransferase family 2 protein [archaeon]